jgi:hypothetical protein
MALKNKVEEWVNCRLQIANCKLRITLIPS